MLHLRARLIHRDIVVGKSRQMSVESDLIMGPLLRVYEEEETSQRKRNAILYSFRPRETSSGKDPTCCLWPGLIPLLTGSRRHVADSLTVVFRRNPTFMAKAYSDGESLLRWRKPTLVAKAYSHIESLLWRKPTLIS